MKFDQLQIFIKFCFVLIATASFAQNEPILEDIYFKDLGGDDAINSIVEAPDGSLVATGYQTSSNIKQLFILAIDANTSKQQFYRNIPSNIELDTRKSKKLLRNAEGKQVLATFDGGFLVVGTKGAIKKMPQTGWILKFDEEGDLLWQQTIEHTQLNGVVQLSNGNFLIVGEQKGHIYAVTIDEHTGKIERQSVFGEKKGIAQAVSRISKEAYAIVGTSRYKGFILTINPLLELLEDFKIIEDLTIAASVIANPNKEQAIVGGTKNAPSSNHFHIFRAPNWKIKLPFRQLLSLNATGKSLTALPNNLFLAVGYTKNEVIAENTRPSTDLNNPVIQFFTDKFREKQLLPTNEIAGEKDDQLHVATTSFNGDAFLAGGFHSGRENLDSRIFRLRFPATESNPNLANIAVTAQSFEDENKDMILNAYERTYIKFELQNKGDTHLDNLTAEVFIAGAAGINFHKTIVLPFLARQQFTSYSIPLLGDRCLSTGIARVRVEIRRGNKILLTLKESIKTKSVPKPKLEIVEMSSSNTLKDDLLKRGLAHKGIINLRVKNVGDTLTENAVVRINYPYLVNSLDEQSRRLSLKKGEIRELNFNFSIDEYYQSDTLILRSIAYLNDEVCGDLVDYESHSFRIHPYDSILLNKNTNRLKPKQGRGGGPNLSVEMPLVEQTIQWHLDSNYTDKRIRIRDVRLKASIICQRDLRQEHITLYQKNSLGVQAYEMPLIRASGRENTYFIYQDVVLKAREKNTFWIEFNDGSLNSVPLSIAYTPPDLHVYALGIHYSDISLNTSLDFTSSDADSLSSWFVEQNRNELYQEVHVNLHNNLDATSNSDHALRRFFSNIAKSTEIENYDKILCFISGHAYWNDLVEKYYIIPNNIGEQDLISGDSLLFNFQNHVLPPLASHNPQKLFFLIDACFAGNVVDIIDKLNLETKPNNHNEIRTYPGQWLAVGASSRDKESFEFKNCGHSYFICSLSKILNTEVGELSIESITKLWQEILKDMKAPQSLSKSANVGKQPFVELKKTK